MDRVKTLIDKLKHQSDTGATGKALLHTVDMLRSELALQIGGRTQDTLSHVLVTSPFIFAPPGTTQEPESDEPEEKIIEVLKVDEEEIENELAELKKHANAMHSLAQHSNLASEYNPLQDVPTLAHQDHKPEALKSIQQKFEFPEIDSTESLNDRLKQAGTELSQSLTATPIKDLRKAIGVNDRFLFINELFRGDEAMYERSIKTIQNFSILAEAEFWISRELRLKLGWNPSDPVVREFDELIRRRFM